MILDFSITGKLTLDMCKYVSGMCEEFPEELGSAETPWTANLFKVDDTSKSLPDKKRKHFHTFTMKGMFVAKRARQDVLPGIIFLSSRTSEPNEGDWKKLTRLMNFLNKTRKDVATLEASDKQKADWYIDAAFAVHNDFKSHTGAGFTLGKGIITSVSTKQKVNTRSSTEAELVGADDVISKVLWTKLFIEAQGFNIENNAHRDNTSCMKLEENGKASSGKRTRHFNIKYFYITDLIKRKELALKYCPTDKIIADYMTKPLVGTKFHFFRNLIMNFPESDRRSVLDNKIMSNKIMSNKSMSEKVNHSPFVNNEHWRNGDLRRMGTV
jgi:hypothetical protein